jgi:predicted  nucleic acid-binding Zn-ribbon protein
MSNETLEKIQKLKEAIEFKYLTLEVTKKGLLDEIALLEKDLKSYMEKDDSFDIDFSHKFEEESLTKTKLSGEG